MGDSASKGQVQAFLQGRNPVPVGIPRTALRPKLLTAFQRYSRQGFLDDLMAGAIVGIVALPLAIAFAIASGVSPDRGLVTAVVAGFLILTLSGSRVNIGSPTGAFVVVVYVIVREHGPDGLMLATLMAGVILIVKRIAVFGSLIKFIPLTVAVGFTSGIAAIIFGSQVRDLLGLPLAEVPAGFFALWPRVSRKIPGSLVAPGLRPQEDAGAGQPGPHHRPHGHQRQERGPHAGGAQGRAGSLGQGTLPARGGGVRSAGPPFFGAAQRFEESLKGVGPRPWAVIMRIQDVGRIDATGLHVLEQFAGHGRARGIRFLLAGAQAQPRQAMERSGLAAEVGGGGFRA